MKDLECDEKEFQYFNNCTFYIHKNYLDDKKQRTIINLITIGGGYYVRSLLPCVTHVITPQYTKQDYTGFTQFGNAFSLIHPEFL